MSASWWHSSTRTPFDATGAQQADVARRPDRPGWRNFHRARAADGPGCHAVPLGVHASERARAPAHGHASAHTPGLDLPDDRQTTWAARRLRFLSKGVAI